VTKAFQSSEAVGVPKEGASAKRTLPKFLRPVTGATDDQTKALWGITLMTFFFGMSVFMVAALMPVYMKTVLGASSRSIGTIEGLAVSASFWARGFSGIGA
jgi:hypothetical protein